MTTIKNISRLGMVAQLVILALGKLRQKDFEFKANMGYIARPYLKKKKFSRHHQMSPRGQNCPHLRTTALKVLQQQI
jgi:hypothetical protein